MKELEEHFIGKGQVKGFRFTQVKKNEFGFIYKIEDFGQVWYEVFKRKENSRFMCVSYPTNKAFGIWAWSVKSFERAEYILVDIENTKEVNNG